MEEKYNIIHDSVNVTLNSIRYTGNWMGCPYYVPSDSSTYLDIDIDGDSINDFRFGVGHKVYTSGGRCDNVSSVSSVISINEAYVIANDENGYCIKTFIKNEDIVNDNNNWQSDGWIDDGIFHCIRNTTFYLGFKKEINRSSLFGWIKVRTTLGKLVIYDYAYNNYVNRDIYAGQTN